MYIRNGQPFDIDVAHEFDNTQYLPGWFHTADTREAAGVVLVDTPVPPPTEPGQVAELVEFVENAGAWSPVWNVRAKTADELAAESQALAAAKAAQDAQINRWRDEANSSTFPHNGKHISIDSLSFKDIAIATGYIALFGIFPPGWPGGWKYTDNSAEPMPTIEEFKAMYHSLATKGTGNFNHAQALKAQVTAATTIDEVVSITW